MVFKRSQTDNFRFWPAMRGRCENLRTLSSSTYSVLPKKLFEPNFYHKMWPLSLFFGLIPVYRSLPVTRHDSYPGHDTVQLFSYHLQNKSGRYLASSGPQLPHKNWILYPVKKTFCRNFFKRGEQFRVEKKCDLIATHLRKMTFCLKNFLGKNFLVEKSVTL